jgi:hypothetical protein
MPPPLLLFALAPKIFLYDVRLCILHERYAAKHEDWGFSKEALAFPSRRTFTATPTITRFKRRFAISPGTNPTPRSIGFAI